PRNTQDARRNLLRQRGLIIELCSKDLTAISTDCVFPRVFFGVLRRQVIRSREERIISGANGNNLLRDWRSLREMDRSRNTGRKISFLMVLRIIFTALRMTSDWRKN